MGTNNKISLFENRDFSSNFSTTIAFLKQNYLQICKGLCFLIPLILIIVFVQPSISGMMNYSASNPSSNITSFYSNLFTLKLLVSYIFSGTVSLLVFTYIVCYFKVYNDSEDGKAQVSEVWKKVFNVIIPIFLGGILYGLSATLGLFLCILPGIAILFLFMFYPHVYVNEYLGLIDCFRRSYNLFKEDWLSSVFLVIIIGIISYLLNAILSIPLMFLSFGAAFQIDFFMSDAYQYLTTMISSLGYIFVLPLIHIAIGIIYFSNRTKLDKIDKQYDIEIMGNYRNEDNTYNNSL